MASKQPSHCNFQYFVDMVKQNKIPWHVFVTLMKDLSYSDVNRLKYLNAILLTELTVSYSDMDRLKYLNVILMNKFKDAIQTEDNVELSDLEVSNNSIIDHDLNDETIKEITSENEIGTRNEGQDFDSPIYKYKDFIPTEDDVELSENEDVENSYTSIVDRDLNEDNIEGSENLSLIHI